MKKILSLLFIFIWSVLCTVAFANPQSVTMVSYEQSWVDSEGTLALKNNTGSPLEQISFRITYLDMNGAQMDYKDFSKEVSIDPGMVRKLNIPSYENSRDYHYYKTPDKFGHTAFKIQFQLLGYRVRGEENERLVSSSLQTDTQSESGTSAEGVSQSDETHRDTAKDLPEDYEGGFDMTYILFLWFVGSIVIVLYIWVLLTAQKYHRSVILWLLLSILITPFVVIFVLNLLGKGLSGARRARSYTYDSSCTHDKFCDMDE